MTAADMCSIILSQLNTLHGISLNLLTWDRQARSAGTGYPRSRLCDIILVDVITCRLTLGPFVDKPSAKRRKLLQKDRLAHEDTL